MGCSKGKWQLVNAQKRCVSVKKSEKCKGGLACLLGIVPAGELKSFRQIIWNLPVKKENPCISFYG